MGPLNLNMQKGLSHSLPLVQENGGQTSLNLKNHKVNEMNTNNTNTTYLADLSSKANNISNISSREIKNLEFGLNHYAFQEKNVDRFEIDPLELGDIFSEIRSVDKKINITKIDPSIQVKEHNIAAEAQHKAAEEENIATKSQEIKTETENVQLNQEIKTQLDAIFSSKEKFNEAIGQARILTFADGKIRCSLVQGAKLSTVDQAIKDKRMAFILNNTLCLDPAHAKRMFPDRELSTGDRISIIDEYGNERKLTVYFLEPTQVSKMNIFFNQYVIDVRNLMRQNQSTSQLDEEEKKKKHSRDSYLNENIDLKLSLPKEKVEAPPKPEARVESHQTSQAKADRASDEKKAKQGHEKEKIEKRNIKKAVYIAGQDHKLENRKRNINLQEKEQESLNTETHEKTIEKGKINKEKKTQRDRIKESTDLAIDREIKDIPPTPQP